MTLDRDDLLAFTVQTVWRDQRVSCPHVDVLRSYEAGGLASEAREFIRFHLEDSACPYCNATLDDLRQVDGLDRAIESAQDRLLRSTVVALRQHRP